jgi:hypothetical protein
MVFLKRKEVPKIQFFLFWGLLLIGITSRRNMPYFMLFSLPLTIYSINKLYLDISGNKDAKARFQIAYNFIRVFAIVLLIFQMYFTFWKLFVFKNTKAIDTGFYPTQAIDHLKEKGMNGEVYSSYGWGGFLIWKLPEKKVFIDGRMPSWRYIPEDPNKETSSAYDDYLEIEKGELDFNIVADKYNIEYVLWPVKKESFMSNLEKKVKAIGLFGKKDEEFSFTAYLNENGWKLVYSDGTSDIYKRFREQRI